MSQCRAGVEQRQAHALAGQAAGIRVVGPHRTQAPVGVEFIAAPAGGIARIAEQGGAGCRSGKQQRAGHGQREAAVQRGAGVGRTAVQRVIHRATSLVDGQQGR